MNSILVAFFIVVTILVVLYVLDIDPLNLKTLFNKTPVPAPVPNDQKVAALPAPNKYITPVKDGNFVPIWSYRSGPGGENAVLDVSGTDNQDGAILLLYGNLNHDNQKFKYHEDRTLRPKSKPDHCATFEGRYDSNNPVFGGIRQRKCVNGNKNQEWYIEPITLDGFKHTALYRSGADMDYCMTVRPRNDSFGNETRAIKCDLNDMSQRWHNPIA